MFEIKSAADFFKKSTADFEDFQRERNNSRLAMNSILSMYHIHEWVWARWMKKRTPITIEGHLIKDKNSFLNFLDGLSPNFGIIQELANGSKHCSYAPATELISGFDSGPFDVGPFDEDYLLIDLGENYNSSDRYLVASDILSKACAFWSAFMKDNSVS